MKPTSSPLCWPGETGPEKNLTFFAEKNILLFKLKNRRLRRGSMTKLTEAEIAWLMCALTPGDCKACVWREQEEDKYRCFPSGESPCKVFVDKVFQGLEKADLI
jgi:hypothetical protein